MEGSENWICTYACGQRRYLLHPSGPFSLDRFIALSDDEILKYCKLKPRAHCAIVCRIRVTLLILCSRTFPRPPCLSALSNPGQSYIYMLYRNIGNILIPELCGAYSTVTHHHALNESLWLLMKLILLGT